MAKPKIPSQKSRYASLNQRLNKYLLLVQQIFDDLNLEAAKAATSVSYDGSKPFRFSDYPTLKKRVGDLQQRYVDDIGAVIYSGTSSEWKKSNEVQDLLADGVLKAYGAQVNGRKYKVYYQPNNDALKAFQKRRANGMTLSQKLWNQAGNYREEMEYAISSAIEKGTSAVTLSKRLSKYLHDFPSLQKDYKDKFGKAVACHDCEYRSMRLARSEINMAYRTAEQERWSQMDFVVGYEIKVSKSHKEKDICDLLQGKYPKDFQWTGWHPNCYSDDMSVLTDSGWKLFSEVNEDDLIMSLNPATRHIEYVPFVEKQCYDVNGSLIRFHNKTLDCLVTEDHRMVYLNKNDGRIKYCSAKDYTKGKGAFYRGCEYEAKDVEFIEVEGKRYNFDDFCEFLGYYLADGSLLRETGIVLSQRAGEPAFEKMLSIIERLGFATHISKDVISFYNSSLFRYLRPFGKSYQKFIPTIVKNASRRQIQIFLDAFILCDGYKRPAKSFVGNRGNVFNSDKEERLYFTTSVRMAGDLSELLLKVGKRPSFTKKLSESHTMASGKVIKSNYPCYVINECSASTSTVFSKEEIEYVGKVYDLTLERNHIMYVSRNGKCFWGSNCMDYKIPILKTEEEFWNYGEAKDKPSSKEVTDVPDAFKKWVVENEARINAAQKRGTLPFFLKDNPLVIQERGLWKDVLDMRRLAISVGGEVQGLAESIAEQFGGVVTPINYKSFGSISRKCKTEGCSPFDLKDVVRNTIIVDADKIEDVLSSLESQGNVLRIKRQTPDQFMGYSGNIVNITTSNGTVAEIQVNTAKMIYAKETPAVAKSILGEDVWKKIAKETGLEGGLGHKFYEQFRVLDKMSPKALEIERLSREYYSHFQPRKATALDIANARHASRTEEQIDDILTRWSRRRIRQLNVAIEDKLLPPQVYATTGKMYQLLKAKQFDEIQRLASPLVKAKRRHQMRTQADIKEIKARWEKRRWNDLAGRSNIIVDAQEAKALKTGLAKSFDIVGFSDSLESLVVAEGGTMYEMRISKATATRFEFEWRGESKEGNSITLYRTFSIDKNGKLECHHDLFAIPESMQGKGFSKKTFQLLYKEYQRMGVDYITVFANIDVGGYCWAKYGFKAKNHFNAVSCFEGLSDDLLEKALNFIDDYYRTNNLPHSAPFPMKLIAQQPWGKDALLNSSWSGILDLSDKAEREFFEKYMFSR